MTTMERNITNSSIVIDGGSSSKIPTKVRPKTGVNRLSVRSRRGMLVKPAQKLSKNQLLGSSIHLMGDASPKLRKGGGSPPGAASLLKLNLRNSNSKRGLNSSTVALNSFQRGSNSLAGGVDHNNLHETLTNLDLRHDTQGSSPTQRQLALAAHVAKTHEDLEDTISTFTLK